MKRSHVARNVGVVILIVLLIFVALVVIGGMGSGGRGGIVPQQHTVNIVNALITVSAGQSEYYQFSIPSGVTGASVQGSFTASGGSGNDIEVLIMDQTAFTNWQNGHSVSAYYSSGQLTTSNFNVALPAGGTYYLVYSNTFSILSSKSVQTTANLIYTS